MKLLEIEQQLRQYLPLYTDKFNNWIDSSISVSSGVATITAVNHGLNAGDNVNIRNVVFENPISAMTSVNGNISATATYNSDLSYEFQETVELSGANEAEFNGTFELTGVTDRQNFSAVTTPFFDGTATGSPVLKEENLARYNNIFEVQSVVDPNTYTINVSDIADFSTTCQSANISSRITSVYGTAQALNYYTKQNNDDYWLFIIPEDTNVSKNRNIGSDFDYRFEHGVEYRQEVEEQISILVVCRASQKVTPTEIMDECRIDIRNALMLSLTGYKPQKTNSGFYNMLSYNGDSPAVYDKAVYSHLYTFSTTIDLKTGDTFIPKSYAVQNINLDYKDNDTNNQLTIANDIIQY